MMDSGTLRAFRGSSGDCIGGDCGSDSLGDPANIDIAGVDVQAFGDVPDAGDDWWIPDDESARHPNTDPCERLLQISNAFYTQAQDLQEIIEKACVWSIDPRLTIDCAKLKLMQRTALYWAKYWKEEYRKCRRAGR